MWNLAKTENRYYKLLTSGFLCVVSGQILSTFKFLDEETKSLRVCPDKWVDLLSPIPVKNNPYYGQKGQFITINGSIDLIPAEKFDLEWIKQNCKIKEPEPVG